MTRPDEEHFLPNYEGRDLDEDLGSLGQALMEALNITVDEPPVEPTPLPTPYPPVVEQLLKRKPSRKRELVRPDNRKLLVLSRVGLDEYMRAHFNSSPLVPIAGISGLDYFDEAIGIGAGTGPLFMVTDGNMKKLSASKAGEEGYIVKDDSYVLWIGQQYKEDQETYFYVLQTPKSATEVRGDLQRAGVRQLPYIKFEGSWGRNFKYMTRRG